MQNDHPTAFESETKHGAHVVAPLTQTDGVVWTEPIIGGKARGANGA